MQSIELVETETGKVSDFHQSCIKSKRGFPASRNGDQHDSHELAYVMGKRDAEAGKEAIKGQYKHQVDYLAGFYEWKRLRQEKEGGKAI